MIVYHHVKLGTQPYGPLKICGNSLCLGETLWVPTYHQAGWGVIARAYKQRPCNNHLSWRFVETTVDHFNEHCLFLSLV